MKVLFSDVWIEEKKMFPPLTENIPEKDCRRFSISQTDITLQEFLINLSAMYLTITIYLTIYLHNISQKLINSQLIL